MEMLLKNLLVHPSQMSSTYKSAKGNGPETFPVKLKGNMFRKSLHNDTEHCNGSFFPDLRKLRWK